MQMLTSNGRLKVDQLGLIIYNRCFFLDLNAFARTERVNLVYPEFLGAIRVVRHVLLSCAKYAHIRRKYFTFNALFELFRDTPAGFIIQFLPECNLYSMF